MDDAASVERFWRAEATSAWSSLDGPKLIGICALYSPRRQGLISLYLSDTVNTSMLAAKQSEVTHIE